VIGDDARHAGEILADIGALKGGQSLGRDAQRIAEREPDPALAQIKREDAAGLWCVHVHSFHYHHREDDGLREYAHSVGRTSWSARVPLDPLVCRSINFQATPDKPAGGPAAGQGPRPTIL
jgi:hypothetical protein